MHPALNDILQASPEAARLPGGRSAADLGSVIPVLCAADGRYVMPLAVTLLSAAQHLTPGWSLEVWLVDGGIPEDALAMLKETLAGWPVELHLVSPAGVELDDLAISHHISRTAYLRLLADRWLPAELSRVIYLDSDLVVQSCLSELWQKDLGDNCLLAAPDIACPWVDAKRGAANFRRCSPWLAAFRPVPNYSEHGFKGTEPYFNSGVMVLNLDAWREQQLGHQLLECLRVHREHVWCWDQYALNCVLVDRWGRLPARWNVGAHTWEYPSPRHAPIDETEFESMLERPAILHFTTEFKPWNFGSRHPRREVFYNFLDQTAWKGWRPVKPPFRPRRAWDLFAAEFCKQWVIGWRKLAALHPRAGAAPQ